MREKNRLDYLFTLITLISTAPSLSIAQDQIARTPWGKPDLNGYWDYHHLTPLRRPSEFEGVEYMDETQAKDWEDNAFNREAERRGRTNPDVNYVGVDLWHEEALDEWETDDHRTALITDPKNGRLPAMLEKLNGVTENTNPSRGRTSLEFHIEEGEMGGCKSS